MCFKKNFIITVDTEGDNLWNWHEGMPIKTECVNFIHRFQELSNKYGFKPTWLTNYEVIMDDRYVDFITKIVRDNAGELGMHLHAWSTPPDYKITVGETGQPYLIEYPESVMDEKIRVMTDTIIARTGIKPVSHRAGRWAMDERYFRLLAKNGYKYDCSVTPHVDWSSVLGCSKGFGGADYRHYSERVYTHSSGITEIPVSIRRITKLLMPENKCIKSFVSSIKRSIVGQVVWLRPNGKNYTEMQYLLKRIYDENDSDYAMLMLHSSELMPGGSPYFKTEESIEKLYHDLEKLFQYATKTFCGVTLKEYGEKIYVI